jgi:hypothetical protein
LKNVRTSFSFAKLLKIKLNFNADIDVEDRSKFTIANEETGSLGRHRIVIATSQGREVLIASSATLGMASLPM